MTHNLRGFSLSESQMRCVMKRIEEQIWEIEIFLTFDVSVNYQKVHPNQGYEKFSRVL